LNKIQLPLNKIDPSLNKITNWWPAWRGGLNTPAEG